MKCFTNRFKLVVQVKTNGFQKGASKEYFRHWVVKYEELNVPEAERSVGCTESYRQASLAIRANMA